MYYSPSSLSSSPPFSSFLPSSLPLLPPFFPCLPLPPFRLSFPLLPVVFVGFEQTTHFVQEDRRSLFLNLVKSGESQVDVDVVFTMQDRTATGMLTYCHQMQWNSIITWIRWSLPLWCFVSAKKRTKILKNRRAWIFLTWTFFRSTLPVVCNSSPI